MERAVVIGVTPSAIDLDQLSVECTGQNSFARWGTVSFIGALVAMLLGIVVRTHGHFAYVIDDAAIHLSMAENLAHSATWGVNPGDYESASSSPLWTLLLAGFARILPPAALLFVPLLLNAVAAVWLIYLLANNQHLLRPAWRRPVEGAAVSALIVIVLFLPGLAVVGMEHTLHAALVVHALVMLERRRSAPADRQAFRVALLVLLLASATRFETVFVGIGVGVGLVVLSLPRLSTTHPPPWLLHQVAQAAVVGATVLVPVLAYGAVNRAIGQDFMPNSVVAKSALGSASGVSISLFGSVQALARDPVVLAGFLLAIGYLTWAWAGGPRWHVLSAVVVAVTAGLHATFAAFGWYERYQAYVIALVVYFVLAAGSEIVQRGAARSARVLLAVLLVVFAIVLAPVKWYLLYQAPLAADNTYRQRLQVARFLKQYYDGQSIATGELGYISWYHVGRVVDVLGLGSYEVLDARRRGTAGPAFWDRLVQRYGVRVVAVYPSSIGLGIPQDWTLVGEWDLQERSINSEPIFQFWAPRVNDVDRIWHQLEEFRNKLPTGVTLRIDLTAAQQRTA